MLMLQTEDTYKIFITDLIAKYYTYYVYYGQMHTIYFVFTKFTTKILQTSHILWIDKHDIYYFCKSNIFCDIFMTYGWKTNERIFGASFAIWKNATWFKIYDVHRDIQTGTHTHTYINFLCVCNCKICITGSEHN